MAALVTAADELIRRTDPEVVRVVWPHQRTVGYGVGPKKMSEHFCYIALHRGHVNLGFNYGAELPDPDGLLAWPGKLLRHVPIRRPAELNHLAMRRLLEAATTHRMPTQLPGP